MNAEGKPANAYKRGTYDQNGNGFKGDVPGGDKNNAFRLPADPTNDTVFCFESPIDLMAHISIYSEPKTNAVALCCLHDGTLEQYLKENPQIKGIVFCLDYDQWGREATERFSAKYSERATPYQRFTRPKARIGPSTRQKRNCANQKGGNVHHPTAFSGPVHLRVDGAAFCILSKFQFKRRNEQC